MNKFLQSHWPALCTGLVLILSVAITYEPVLQNNFVDWDDGFLILDNEYVHGLSMSNIKTAFTSFDPELYTPFSLLSFQADYTLGGLDPMVFHRTNLVLHIINTVLVLLLILQIFQRSQKPEDRNQLSASLILTSVSLASFLFALHPLHTETVAWASARKDLLCTMFYILSLLAYIHYTSNTQKKFYVLSITLFLCALFSKVSAVTLPLILLLFNYIFIRQQRQHWKQMVPYFIAAIFFGLLAIFGKPYLETDIVSVGLLVPQNILYGLSKIFLPHSLAIMHPIEAVSLFYTFASFGTILVLLCGLLQMQKKYPLIAFGGLFAIITIAPSSLNSIGRHEWTLAYDRYSYLPSIGITLCMAYAIYYVLYRFVQYKYHICAVIIFLAIFFGVLTRQQVLTWHTSETLFAHLLQKYPNSHTGHIRLSNYYQVQAQETERSPTDAIQLYRQALAHTPSDPELLTNIGSTFGKMDNLEQEIFWYTQALSHDEDFKVARYNLALALRTNRQYKEADTHLQILVDGGGFLNAKELLQN